jgi:hypothetical protein
MRSLYSMDINPSLGISYDLQIFSPIPRFLFILLIVFFAVQEHFKFDVLPHVCLLFWLPVALVSYPKK